MTPAQRRPYAPVLGTLPVEGHMHLATQPCHWSCEPDERLRCRCLGAWNDPEFGDQCHLRATQEDGVCDDCRERCVPEGAGQRP